MDGKSQDIIEDQKDKLRQLFPEVFTEDKIDWDKLKATLGQDVELGERYGLGWKGKSSVFAKIQEKTATTLHPRLDQSSGWSHTQNLFIEGDNLDALKTLHKAYYGQVKVIYIDPPYNTGSDLVYNDDFKQAKREHDIEAGIADDEGNVTRDDGLRTNSSGHKHSNWANMMYPRLFLARNLLCQDGVIFISIDDNEVHNLRLILNEIFGEENFISQMVWEKGRKNDAKLISNGHEYLILYARNLQQLKDSKTVWREPKPGAKEIWDQYLVIKKETGTNYAAAEAKLKEWYSSLPKSHPSKKLARYKHIDKYGPWRDSDISWPGGGGPRYEVVHPVTGIPCAIPERGWRFATPESMERQIKFGLVVFREDHTEPPIRKAHLFPPAEELLDDDEIDDTEDDDDATIGLQVMPSVIYKQSQVAVKYLRKLMGGQKVFDNPKDHEVLARLIKYVGVEDNDIVLDFFAGSGTTAEAVERVNASEDKNIRWIMVQLPESLDASNKEQKIAYDFCVANKLDPNIASIARERIKRAGEEIRKEYADKISAKFDSGFRSYTLGDSNFKLWNDLVTNPDEIRQQTLDHLDPLEATATDESLLTEIMLKRGISPLTSIETHNGFVLVPSERVVVCLARQMTQELFGSILKTEPAQVILLDIAFKDDLNLKTNIALQAEKQKINLEIL